MTRDAAMEDVATTVLPRWMRRLDAPDCAAAMSPLSVADTAALIASFHAPTTTDAAADNKRARAPSPWFHELLATCLAFVDGVALLKCELVSREWLAAVQEPALWAALYSTAWRGGAPLPAPLLARARAQLKRVCRARSTTPLGLSTRAMWWVHDNQTLRVHNVSLQRTFSRGCVESVRADHALRPLALSQLDDANTEGVCYYEATIRGCGSVGVVRLDEPNVDRYYGAGSSAHVGWLPGSYGYHGDDGKIYWHDGTAPIGGYAVRYGPSWGDTRVLQSALPAEAPGQRGATVGCGVDLASGRLFFTRNGEFLGHATMPVERSRRGICATVSLHHLGDTAELNFGRAAFAFDIEAYLAERAAAPAF